MKTRVYLIENKKNDEERYLVEANSISQALRHVAQATYTCDVLNAVNVARAMNTGLSVQIADDSRKH